MEKYFNEALIGNKEILVTYTKHGEIQRMYYPAKDNRQYISFYHTGVKVNDSDLVYLHDDINNSYNQYYDVNTNIYTAKVVKKFGNVTSNSSGLKYYTLGVLATNSNNSNIYL